MRLCDAIETHRGAIVEAWLGSVRPNGGRALTELALLDGMPRMLELLVTALREGRGFDGEMFDEISQHHAVQRLRQGYSLQQIVGEYSAFRSAILARVSSALSGNPADDIQRLNAYLDLAVADAVQRYVEEQRRAKIESEARLQAVIDNAPALIFMKEYRRSGGTYMMLNRHYAREFGLDAAAAVGRTDRELFADVDASFFPAFEAHDRHVYETGEVLHVDEEFPRGGEVRVWRMVKFPLRDTDGVPYAVGGIATDVTEERELARSRERLIGVLAHDLRSPLASISLAAELLLRWEEIDEGPRRQVVKIARGADRMAKLTTDLLDFAQGQLGGGIPITRAPCDLGPITRAVVDEIETSNPERTIRIALDGDLAGDWDEGRVGQVLANLINNAIVHGEGDVDVAVRGDRDGASVRVHNAGAPIPAALRPHLFAPFHGSRAAGGLGLGLYIVRQIALGHGGDVTVESDDRGTTFVARLARA